VVVLETLPEHAQRECLSVVHISFTGIVSQDSVDHDLFFSFVEPAVLATEFGGGLCGRWWNVEPGNYADDACETAFQSKEPTPSLDTVDASHVEEAKGEESRHDTRELVGEPEVAKPNGKLSRRVPVTQVQDVVRNLSRSV
jgi:hypothetical protein